MSIWVVGRSLAREETLGREHGEKIAVDFEDVALADRACDDLHG
jgi:hypothetical protein